jgi:hypothetical protein
LLDVHLTSTVICLHKPQAVSPDLA